MNIAKLRGKFAECNLPLYKGAQCLGISERTFYSKIQICKYRYANYVAKLSVNPNADVPKWVRTANGNPLDYIIEHSLD